MAPRLTVGQRSTCCAWCAASGYTAEAPTVDHAASRLTVKLKVDNTVSPFTQISCSQQRYPTGIVATVQPAGMPPIPGRMRLALRRRRSW